MAKVKMSRAEERALAAYPRTNQVQYYHREGFVLGYEQAEKDLGWHSVDESLPPIDEEVIVLTDEVYTAPIYKIGVEHIVDTDRAVAYKGWNIPFVKYWMPCPELPEK